MPEPMLTADDVAHRLNVGRMCVYRWARAGHIESVVLNRARRFPPDALERFIEAHRQPEREVAA